MEGRGIEFFGGNDIQQNGKVQNFGLVGGTTQIPPLVRYSDLPIRKPLRRVFGLRIIIILKRLSGNIFFQSNKFKACKVKDGKLAENYLIVFNLLKIIHPFQGKKHIRT